MKYRIVKKSYLNSLMDQVDKLKDELAFYKASEEEYKLESENLRKTLSSIKNGDCAPGAYCEHCAYGGKVELRRYWGHDYDYVCLKEVPCKQFGEKGAPIPQEGANSHD